MADDLNKEIEFIENFLTKSGYSFDARKLHDLPFWQVRTKLYLEIEKNGITYKFKKLLKFDEKNLALFNKEIQITRCLASQNFPAKLCDIIIDDSERHWFIASFIHGVPAGNILDFDPAVGSEIEAGLLDVISALQKIDHQELELEKIDPSNQINRLVKNLASFGYVELSNQCERLFEANSSLLKDESKYILAHGDLSPLNILLTDDGEIGVIDWETGSLRDAGYDGAYIAHRFIGDKKRYNDFISKLRGKLSEEQLALANFWLVFWKMFDIVSIDKFFAGSKFTNSEAFSETFLRERKAHLLAMLSEEHIK